MERKKTRVVQLGNVKIGGDHPVSIQSMLNTKNGDVDAAVEQCKRLKDAGCEIIRLAVTDEDSIRVVEALKKQIDVPLVADIQFDYKLALR